MPSSILIRESPAILHPGVRGWGRVKDFELWSPRAGAVGQDTALFGSGRGVPGRSLGSTCHLSRIGAESTAPERIAAGPEALPAPTLVWKKPEHPSALGFLHVK